MITTSFVGLGTKPWLRLVGSFQEPPAGLIQESVSVVVLVVTIHVKVTVLGV